LVKSGGSLPLVSLPGGLSAKDVQPFDTVNNPDKLAQINADLGR
jgi:hypothetical protein